jgi:hypothetical protein
VKPASRNHSTRTSAAASSVHASTKRRYTSSDRRTVEGSRPISAQYLSSRPAQPTVTSTNSSTGNSRPPQVFHTSAYRAATLNASTEGGCPTHLAGCRAPCAGAQRNGGIEDAGEIRTRDLWVAVIAGVIVVHTATLYVIYIAGWCCDNERIRSGMRSTLVTIPAGLGAVFVLGPRFVAAADVIGDVAAHPARRGSPESSNHLRTSD